MAFEANFDMKPADAKAARYAVLQIFDDAFYCHAKSSPRMMDVESFEKRVEAGLSNVYYGSKNALFEFERIRASIPGNQYKYLHRHVREELRKLGHSLTERSRLPRGSYKCDWPGLNMT